MKLFRCATIMVSSLLAFPHLGIAQGTTQATAPATNPDPSLQTEVINDPTLGMKAFTVNIPSGWKFQGTVTAELSCNLPSPVFRAYSLDGLTEIRLLPSFTWEIQEKSAQGWEGLGQNQECIYLNGTMTAAQFLDRYVRTLQQASVIGPMSISAEYRQQLDQLISKMNANELKGATPRTQSTGEAAAVRIETTNGTFTIEQRIRARVVCTLWAKAIAGKLGDCSARIDVLRAPKGQLDALVNLVDSHNLTTAKNDDLWLNRLVEQIRGDRVNHFDPYVPNRGALVLLYRQANDFNLVQRSEGERRVSTPFAFTRDPLPTDWADFAVDSAFRRNPDGTMRVAPAIYKWSSSDGQHYQTRNPDANPNWVLAGQWKEEIVQESSSPQ